MKHMLGDYYSSLPPVPGLFLALVLFVILVVIIVVSLRMKKLERDRLREMSRSKPTIARSTYIDAQRMKVEESSDSFNNRR